jgi:hypothetical protein
MKLYDLIKIYAKARDEAIIPLEYHPTDKAERAGMRAVVFAMREAIVPSYLRSDIERPVKWYRDLFDEIIASDILKDDPYYNLMGALHDLKRGTNDKVVWDTIERVLKQIKDLKEQ